MIAHIIANQLVVLRTLLQTSRSLTQQNFFTGLLILPVQTEAADVFSETNLNTILAFIKEALQWLHLIYNQNLSKFLQISTLTSPDSFLQRIP